MRLAALLDVDLELGMPFVEAGEQGIELRLLLAGEERHDAPWLGEETFGNGGCHLVEVSAAGDGLVRDEPEKLPLAHGDPVELGIPRRNRDFPGRNRLEDLPHLD